MKFRRICALLLAVACMIFSGCSASETDVTAGTPETRVTDGAMESDDNQIVSFRPADCGIQSQDSYEYPFLGLNFVLPDTLLEKIDSREVFVFTQEDYTPDSAISYGLLRFSATTEEQRQQEGMSVDIFAWEENLEKIGAIGVYHRDVVTELDALTFCDTHEKIGESSDGAYEYYLSTSSGAETALTEELHRADIAIDTMHTLNPELGYSAFSTDRLEGIDNVGSFSTEDIFGNACNETVFQDCELTLVNVFATWCSPCVEEMPELEQLRQEYADKGIRLGVVAVVLDIGTVSETDGGALERAKTLYEKSGARFPFLIPDDGYLGGRLTGIESVPESFFVDGNGNIVSEPYIGARNLEQWRQIVDTELAALRGASE